GGERVTTIQNVVEDQNVPTLHVGRSDLFENDFSTGLGFAVITGHAEAIELERQRNSTKQISHKHQTAVQNCDDGQLTVAIIARNFGRDLVQPAQNGGLIK